MRQRERGQGGLIRVKGSPYWYLLYWHNGRQIKESSKTMSKMQAEALLQQRLGEKAIGKQPAQELKKLKYDAIRDALLADYAIKRRRSLIQNSNGETVAGLKHLDAFFDGKSVSKILTDTLREFIKKRQKDGAEPSTINRNLSLLRRMFFLAHKEGKVQSVPYFPMLKENPPRKGFVEREQFEKLRPALPERLRPIVTFLYWTGCRLGEAMKIQWDQVDLAAHQVRLEGDQTKNSEPRILPLPGELVEMLSQLRGKSGHGHIFPVGSFRKAWQSTCVKAGLGRWEVLPGGSRRYDGLIVHDLRRSAIRNMIAAGIPENVAMKISGHKTQSVFRRYHIVSTEDLHRAMNRVEAASRVIENDENPMKILVWRDRVTQ